MDDLRGPEYEDYRQLYPEHKAAKEEAADQEAQADADAQDETGTQDKEEEAAQEVDVDVDPSMDPNAPVQGPAEGSRHYLTDGIISFSVMCLCLYAVFGPRAVPGATGFANIVSAETAQRVLSVLRSLAVGFFVALMVFVQFNNLYTAFTGLGALYMGVAGLLVVYLTASGLYGVAQIGGSEGLLRSKAAQYGVGLVALLALCANCTEGAFVPKSFASFWTSLIAVWMADYVGLLPDGGAALQLQRAFGVVVISDESTARSTREGIEGLFDFDAAATQVQATTTTPPEPDDERAPAEAGTAPPPPPSPPTKPTTYVANTKAKAPKAPPSPPATGSKEAPPPPPSSKD